MILYMYDIILGFVNSSETILNGPHFSNIWTRQYCIQTKLDALYSENMAKISFTDMSKSLWSSL